MGRDDFLALVLGFRSLTLASLANSSPVSASVAIRHSTKGSFGEADILRYRRLSNATDDVK